MTDRVYLALREISTLCEDAVDKGIGEQESSVLYKIREVLWMTAIDLSEAGLVLPGGCTCGHFIDGYHEDFCNPSKETA